MSCRRRTQNCAPIIQVIGTTQNIADIWPYCVQTQPLTTVNTLTIATIGDNLLRFWRVSPDHCPTTDDHI